MAELTHDRPTLKPRIIEYLVRAASILKQVPNQSSYNRLMRLIKSNASFSAVYTASADFPFKSTMPVELPPVSADSVQAPDFRGDYATTAQIINPNFSTPVDARKAYNRWVSLGTINLCTRNEAHMVGMLFKNFPAEQRTTMNRFQFRINGEIQVQTLIYTLL